jgi:hypothetical protein
MDIFGLICFLPLLIIFQYSNVSHSLHKRKPKFNRTVPQLEQTKSLEKKYKKVMDRCIRIHRKKMRQKIHNLRSINPKEYWKIINSGRKQISPNITINVLFDFFKTPNTGEPEN